MPLPHHVAILFDRFGPYHLARLRAAAQQLRVTGIEFFGRSADYAWDPVDTPDDFRCVTLFPDADRSTVPAREMRDRTFDGLSTCRPDAVALPGWAHPGSLSALQWCLDQSCPAIIMSATAAQDFDRVWWKEAAKRRVVAQCSAGLVGGPAHRDYLSALGLSADCIFLGYDVVDNDHFADGAATARAEAARERAARNLPKRYFLASNRFVPKKNLPRLIEAFATYRQHAPSNAAWELVLLGDGEERPAVETACHTHGVTEAVHLPGFKQYNDLPAYYGLAGAFVHASTREQWGLVVNEAMAAGLPVIVSNRCGCAETLVEPGGNGYIFDPYDIEALAGHLLHIAHGPVDRAAMGARSCEIISNWRPATFGTAMRRAVETACAEGSSFASWSDHLFIEALMRR